MSTRRTLLLLSAAAAVTWASPRLLARASPLPETRPIRTLPGYVKMQTGALTATPALAGLDQTPTPPADILASARAAPADLLFDAPPPGSVPIAVFNDVNCPNCRPLSATLIDWLQTGAQPIHVTWHELPRLGASSLMGARAALAAGLQGAYLPMHKTLLQNRFRPSPAYVRAAADEIGIDPDRLIADMDSAEVAAQLGRADLLAYLFGIPGTPAMVIDRTLVIGALTTPLLRRLIRRTARGLAS